MNFFGFLWKYITPGKKKKKAITIHFHHLLAHFFFFYCPVLLYLGMLTAQLFFLPKYVE